MGGWPALQPGTHVPSATSPPAWGVEGPWARTLPATGPLPGRGVAEPASPPCGWGRHRRCDGNSEPFSGPSSATGTRVANPKAGDMFAAAFKCAK